LDGGRSSIEHLYKKAIKEARYRGHSEIAEDFAGWITLKWLEGKAQHQTLSQSLIDYLRGEYGSAGIRCGSDALLRSRRAKTNSQELNDETVEESLERLWASSSYAEAIDRESSDNKQESVDTRELISIRDETFYKMIIEDEMTLKEVGDVFGITESRVSQIWAETKKRSFTSLGLNKLKEKLQDNENFTKVEVEWITL
jgi:DNA-binding Xre family transcriptional regulator